MTFSNVKFDLLSTLTFDENLEQPWSLRKAIEAQDCSGAGCSDGRSNIPSPGNHRSRLSSAVETNTTENPTNRFEATKTHPDGLVSWPVLSVDNGLG